MNVLGFKKYTTMMRKRVIRNEDGVNKYLLVNFRESEQEKDLKKTKGYIKGSINNYFRVKTNLKNYMLDAYDLTKKMYNKEITDYLIEKYYNFWIKKLRKYAIDEKDFQKMKNFATKEQFTKYGEERTANKLLMFDMDFWAIKSLEAYDFKHPEDVPRNIIEKYSNVFMYQLKGCNLNCNFCFVDNESNNGLIDKNKPINLRAKYFTMREIVNNFIKERNKRMNKSVREQLNQFRPTGGEPSLAPEQYIEAARLIEEYGLRKKVHVQSDCNLTTGHAMEEWDISANTLSQAGGYNNFSILACFKGSDPENLAHNCLKKPHKKISREELTLGEYLLKEQKYTFRKLINSGIRTYAYIINPDPETLPDFVDDLKEEYGKKIVPFLHILKIGPYGPVVNRYGDKLDEAVKNWDEYYKKGQELLDKKCLKECGVHYKEIARPLIKLFL